MGKYIPGNPSMVVVNMTGGGGIIAANYMAQVAPRDGTVIGIVSQGLAADQALGMSPQLKANLREFGWLANVNYSNQLLVGVAHLGDQDAGGCEAAGHAPSAPPARARRRCSIPPSTIICSAPASRSCSDIRGGADIDLAMERGEVEGRGTNPYSSYMATHPDWIPKKLLIPLVQAGVEKEPELPHVPNILDLEVKPQDKPLLRFMANAVDGRAPAGRDAWRARRPGGGVARGVCGDDAGCRVHRGRRRKRSLMCGRRAGRR